MKLVICIALASLPGFSQTPGIAEIMARVAANQKKSVEARKLYVYHQERLVSLHRGHGKLAREEKREYTVTPDAHGSERQMTAFEGKYEDHGKLAAYDKPGYETKGMDIDGELVSVFQDGDPEFARQRGDGVPHDLFPLTSAEQRKYLYKLEGTEMRRRRLVYRIGFVPKPRHDEDEEGGKWKGDALIDAAEFQPVQITTSLAWKVPLGVRVMLGTNVRGVGFTVSYERVADGIWFPATFGGEFDVRAVFFYKRTISVNLKNSDFRRADVKSTLAFNLDKQ